MTMTPEALLDSPRGRRLCLEWAKQCLQQDHTGAADGLAGLLTDAVFAFDMAGGGNVLSVGFASIVGDVESYGDAATTAPMPSQLPDDSERRVLEWYPHWRAHRDALESPSHRWTELRPPSIADFARILDAVPLRVPSSGDSFRLIADVTAMAAYWQPLDGSEVAVTDPGMRDSLLRIARSILASPDIRWWDTPMDPTSQWLVQMNWDGQGSEFDPIERLTRPRDIASVLCGWHRGACDDEEQFREYEREGGIQAGGWWSALPGWLDIPSSTRELPGVGPVAVICQEDAGNAESAVGCRLRVPSDAHVLEIDGPEAWRALCSAHALPATASRRGTWSVSTDWQGEWVLPDWEAISHEVDAVHLSVWGYLTTAGAAVDLGDSRASVLAGWNPDTTFWLRPVADVIDEGLTEWREIDSNDPWAPPQWDRVR